MESKIEVGKTLWLYNIDRRDKSKYREVTVIRVGRKYFYVKSYYYELKFDIKTLKQYNEFCSPDYKLYNSKGECEYYLQTEEKRKIISDKLYKFLTMDEVNELYGILIQRDK